MTFSSCDVNDYTTEITESMNEEWERVTTIPSPREPVLISIHKENACMDVWVLLVDQVQLDEMIRFLPNTIVKYGKNNPVLENTKVVDCYYHIDPQEHDGNRDWCHL